MSGRAFGGRLEEAGPRREGLVAVGRRVVVGRQARRAGAAAPRASRDRRRSGRARRGRRRAACATSAAAASGSDARDRAHDLVERRERDRLAVGPASPAVPRRGRRASLAGARADPARAGSCRCPARRPRSRAGGSDRRSCAPSRSCSSSRSRTRPTNGGGSSSSRSGVSVRTYVATYASSGSALPLTGSPAAASYSITCRVARSVGSPTITDPSGANDCSLRRGVDDVAGDPLADHGALADGDERLARCAPRCAPAGCRR